MERSSEITATTLDPGLGDFPVPVPGLGHRWAQLTLGLVCMAMVANLQYGWTLFVNPQTFCVPFAGYWVDRAGPRPVVFAGGLLCAIAWVMNALADSLGFLYVGAAIGGFGAGCVYGTCVGNALKWFPDKRGLAVGLTVAAFGAGS